MKIPMSVKRMKMGTRILLPALFITVIFSTILYFVSGTVINRLILLSVDEKIRAKVFDITASQERLAGEMLTQAALFSRARWVKEAFDVAHKGNINDENDPKLETARSMLRNYFLTIEEGYGSVQKGKSFHIHFHLPPARSLLRLWRKNQHKSDDLSNFRNTVLTISENHKPIKGIEIGRGGFVIRGLAPVFKTDGSYAGSTEVLSSYDPIVRSCISSEKEYIAVYMDKEFLPIATELQNPRQNPVIDDRFVFVSSTNKQLTDSLLTAEILTSNEKVRLGDYLENTIPVIDFSGKQIGAMAYVLDASDLFGAFRKIRNGIAAICLLLLAGIAGSLTVIVRKVTGTLRGAIKTLTTGSDGLTKAANEINIYSQSLAEGASEQAASIEETSSSLEEVSAMSRQSAESAKQAESLIGRANQIIANTSNAMNSLTGAMSEINNASDETQKIIKTIDEIAFQTNLLALNAAVEAARAGEAGSGFAVVADEVRSLAIRTTEAARNTTDLIGGSVKKTGEGVGLAASTNSEVEALAEAAEKVLHCIAEVSTASGDQSRNIEQVNLSVNEMNTVVQQNAASAEESASVAAEVNVQAVRLTEIVAGLKLLIDGGRTIDQSVTAGVPTAFSIKKALPAS